MKNPILILFILIGCQQPQSQETTNPKTAIEIVNENISTYIQNNAHDPASYQFISTVWYDTVTYLDNLEDRIARVNGTLEGYRLAMLELPEDDVKEFERLQSKKDSILNSPNPNRVAAYVFLHKCRMNNAMGALNLGNYYVETDPNFDLLNFTDEDKKRLAYPGGLPK